MSRTIHSAHDRWTADLDALGFTRREGSYRRNGTLLNPGRGWVALESARPLADADPLRDQLGRPGLWKLVRGDDGVRRVFELPEAALTAEESDESEEASSLRACVRWALDTEAGTVPEGWQPPPREELDAWLPVGRLIVQTGPAVRQGELVHSPERLALRFALVHSIPEELNEVRRQWLQEVLAEAQDRWRMVRVGLTAGGAALAEVDFTGCPRAALEVLFPTGLDALRWVVAGLVKVADFLADPASVSRALEVRRARA
ncbi:MAG: hypothetical protein L0Z62_04340 [Gemmataceae bacterium]|nr:hypothetical protein [Gemmataceae bacterium]